MKFSPAILLPFLMYCSQFAHAEYFAAPYFREAAVNVDGILNEEIYSCLEFISFDSRLTHSGKTDIAIVEGRSEKNTTGAAGNRFAVFHDCNGLYMAIISPLDNAGEKLSSSCEMPDGLFEFFRCDDMFEIYIDPDMSGHDYYWFMTNPEGNKTDLWAEADPDRSWNGIWETASKVTEHEWIAEFFFPYGTFNRTPLGDSISLSISRFKPAGMQRLRWGGEFRMPSTWPEIKLQKSGADIAPPVKLTAMKITDDNTPGKGILTAEVSGIPADMEVNAKWLLMRPMEAAGWTPEGNGPRFEIPATAVSSSETRIFADKTDIRDDEALIAVLALYDSDGKLYWMSRDMTLSKEHIIGGPGCEFNYYTDEKEINVRLFLPPLSGDVKLTAELHDSCGAITASRSLSPSAQTDFSFAAESLEPGKYIIRTILCDKAENRIIAEREFPLVKYAPSKNNEVKISFFNRSVQINGNDFSSIGNSPQLHTFDLDFALFRMQQYKEFDFNTLLIFGGYYTIDETGIYFDEELLEDFFIAARENNFKVIIGMGEWLGHAPHSPFVKHHFPDKYRFSKVLELVELVKDQESLLGYEAYDEPEWFMAPEYLENVYRMIKEKDPYHIVTLNGCRSARNLLQFLRASDLVSIDYYPSGKWPANTVVPVVEEMRSFPGYKPLRWWIQAYEIFNPAPPTREEIIAMTYMAWAHGTSSILYFIGVPAGVLAEAQKECGRENLLLTDALTAPYQEKLNVYGNTSTPGVYASLRIKNGKSWIITINQCAQTQNVAIDIPGNPKRIFSIFENQEIESADGNIRCTYAPWERKVFEIYY